MHTIKIILLSIIIIIILGIGFADMTVAQVMVSLQDTTSKNGVSIAIPINVDDITGKNIVSIGLSLTFDNNILNVKNAYTTGSIAESWGNPTFNSTSGQLTIGMAGTAALSGSGPLIYITFNVIGGAGDTTTIHFDNILINEGNPIAITKDGFFTVEGRPTADSVKIIIPDTTAPKDSRIAIPIKVDDVTGKNIFSVGVLLSFNNAVLNAQNASTSGTIAESWGSPTFNTIPGQASIGMAGTTSVSGSGPLFYVMFEVIGNAGDTTTIHFENILINEGQPAAIAKDGLFSVQANTAPVDTVNVMIPDTSATKNSWITIPIIVDDVTDLGILSIGIILNFDQNVLDSAYATTTQGTISEDWGEPAFNNDIPGQMSIAIAGSEALRGRGSLLFLSFHVIGSKGDTSAIHFGKMFFNEGDPMAITHGGLLVVINSPPDAFNLHLPADNAIVNTLNPTLHWLPSNDVDNDRINYNVIWDTDSLLSSPTLGEISTSKTFWTIMGGLEPSKTYFWKVIAVDEDEAITMCIKYFKFTTSPTATNIDFSLSNLIPENFEIYQNYPNPFNPETTIKYQLPEPSEVTIRIFNITGQLVRIILEEHQPAGYHSIVWDGKDDLEKSVSSGIYFYQLQVKVSSVGSGQNFVQKKKMILVR